MSPNSGACPCDETLFLGNVAIASQMLFAPICDVGHASEYCCLLHSFRIQTCKFTQAQQKLLNLPIYLLFLFMLIFGDSPKLGLEVPPSNLSEPGAWKNHWLLRTIRMSDNSTLVPPLASNQGPTTPRKGPPKFKQRQTRQFKSKPPKKGVKGFGDDIPGMEGLGTDITVICPWEAFSHLELHELAQFGII